MLKTAGWKLLEEDLLREADELQALLSENRIHTVQETAQIGNTTKTFITTAEEQRAEAAGRYRLIRDHFNRIQTILEAPQRLAQLEREGKVIIDQDKTRKAGAPPPPTIPLLMRTTITRIRELLGHRKGAR